MSLDDFVSDDKLRKAPPNEDKWRYEEPGKAEWEEYMTFDEVEQGDKEMGVVSMTMSREAYLACTVYVEVKN